MTTRALAVLAVACGIGCVVIVAVSTSPFARVVAAVAGVLIAFLLGLGTGERSNSVYCRELSRINRLLSDLAADLSEANVGRLKESRRDFGPHFGDPLAKPPSTSDAPHDHPS
ncbi:hypothetical protein [Botrimarina sp.]|uniref:hypothetical protein n=1 Tax=Botrimarina sp. TaxID=2795802 RepID=UPI0032ED643C